MFVAGVIGGYRQFGKLEKKIVVAHFNRFDATVRTDELQQ